MPVKGTPCGAYGGRVSSSLLPITTERLRLRAHTAADAGWLQRVYGRPDVALYLLDEPWTAELAAVKVSERIARVDLDGESRGLALAVERDGEAIGDVVLWRTGPDARLAEIGWVLDPAHGGHGYAREAVSALLTLAFEHYGLHRVAAQMDARNTASARLAEAVGMRREAHLRANWWSKGEWTDTLIFGALLTDR